MIMILAVKVVVVIFVVVAAAAVVPLSLGWYFWWVWGIISFHYASIQFFKPSSCVTANCLSQIFYLFRLLKCWTKKSESFWHKTGLEFHNRNRRQILRVHDLLAKVQVFATDKDTSASLRSHVLLHCLIHWVFDWPAWTLREHGYS